MTKGGDVNQLYTRLGLKPSDYQEVRAEEEVMHSIEERWPLLRDLLTSLAKSLDEVGAPGDLPPAVPPPVPAATSSDAPGSAPPPPSWLNSPSDVTDTVEVTDIAPGRDSGEDASLPETPEFTTGSPDAPSGQGPVAADDGETLADRLERLYGSSAPEAGSDQETGSDHGAGAAEPEPETETPPEPAAAPPADQKPASPRKATGRGLLESLLSRKDDGDVETGREQAAAEQKGARWQLSETDDQPPPIELAPSTPGQPETAAEPRARRSGADAELSGIFQRLAPARQATPQTEKPKAAEPEPPPRRDLQSTFARLRNVTK